MKCTLTVFLIIVGALLGMPAYGQCDFAFDKAYNLFKSGRYKEAKMQFEWCSTHCKDRSESTYKGWIDKCDSKIKGQEQAAARRRKAEAEAIAKKEVEAREEAERMKKESQERKERVERNRHIYISVSNAVEGNFNKIEYELEDDLYNIDTSLTFTRDSLEAYWFVRVGVNIYGDMSNSRDAHFYYVEACIEVEDATTSKVRRSRVLSEKDGTFTIPEEKAPQWVANKVYNTQRDSFYKKILDAIKKHIQR